MALACTRKKENMDAHQHLQLPVLQESSSNSFFLRWDIS